MPSSGGFSPVRTLDGSNTFSTQRFRKLEDNGDASLVYVGDVVMMTANGRVKRLLAAQTTAAGSVGVLGVVQRILQNEDGRPRVHGLPDQHPNISLTAQADFLDVYVSPEIVYEAFTDTSAGRSMIGQTMNIALTARITAAGRSGMILDTTSSASQFNPFKVMQVSDFVLDSRAGDVSARVQCVINHSVFNTRSTF